MLAMMKLKPKSNLQSTSIFGVFFYLQWTGLGRFGHTGTRAAPHVGRAQCHGHGIVPTQLHRVVGGLVWEATGTRETVHYGIVQVWRCYYLTIDIQNCSFEKVWVIIY